MNEKKKKHLEAATLALSHFVVSADGLLGKEANTLLKKSERYPVPKSVDVSVLLA
jgi:hypothetical protein